jgi:hypothetical protein
MCSDTNRLGRLVSEPCMDCSCCVDHRFAAKPEHKPTLQSALRSGRDTVTWNRRGIQVGETARQNRDATTLLRDEDIPSFPCKQEALSQMGLPVWRLSPRDRLALPRQALQQRHGMFDAGQRPYLVPHPHSILTVRKIVHYISCSLSDSFRCARVRRYDPC